MNHSPLQCWADRHPIRWAVVLSAIVVLWIASGVIADKTKDYTDVYRAGLDAQAQESQELAHRRALQELCGGPEATVVDLANGGYACLDTNGRRTKTIPGLARPVSQGPEHAARVFGARLQQTNFECANSFCETESAGLVPAGFLWSLS